MSTDFKDTDSMGSTGNQSSDSDTREGKAVAVGILPNGNRFYVPETMSVVSSLLLVRSWKTSATIIWIFLAFLTALTYWFYYINLLPKWFFCLQFIIWRLSYNIGLGLILYYQSKGQHFLSFYRHFVKQNPNIIQFLESSIIFKNTSMKYEVNKYPDEFNSWMIFRVFVNIILANDLVSYIVLYLVCREPLNLTSPQDVLCFLLGFGSIIFALWSKSDAHRIIGDYAWYWGDFFFLLDKNLVFDGIFQMFPHPMYTVGYAFMYGVPLMAKSYTLFYLSVFGHLSQLLFLAIVENPHIDRTYSVMKKRTDEEILRDEILYSEDGGFLRRSELVILKRFNPFRAEDFLLALVIIFAVIFAFIPIASYFHVVHHIFWRLYLNGILGIILYKEVFHNKWFSNHYKTPQEAFNNWRILYNTGVTMVGITYVLCAFRYFSWNMIFFDTLESRIFTLIVGILLLGINIYISLSIYKAIGDFGFYYGDFFVDNVPSTLTYNGIYRFLNNPDSSLGMSGYYGIALISGSPNILCLALFSHLCVKTFEILVEQPHMHRRYGKEVRTLSGLEQELKRKVNNARMEYERKVQELKEELEKKNYSYKKLRKSIYEKRRSSTKVE